MQEVKRLLIVGNPGEEHVGSHFLSAAREIGMDARLLDTQDAYSANRWINRLSRRLLRHRPPRLGSFSEEVLKAGREFQPQLLLVTGIAPPSAAVLRALGARGIRRVNFLTDDPWNSRNGAGFFWPALREYDTVYSPRRANMADLSAWGCRQVRYLRFGYNPRIHFPPESASADDQERFACDVAIIGGADGDRVPLALDLARAGLKLRLYGGYWDRHRGLRAFHRGFVHGADCRQAARAATVNLCMVRRANRDGHAMRSLELPAMRATLLVEDTPDHRELFGADGESVEFYSDRAKMVALARALCEQPDRAHALAENVFRRITLAGRHTYTDRLRSILAEAD